MSLQAPSSVHASPGNLSGTVTWTAPAGGDSVDGYHVVIQDADAPSANGLAHFELDGAARSLNVGNLVNGRPYYFQVSAKHGTTVGPPAATSTFRPLAAAVPGVPTNVRMKAGDHAVVIRWGKPATTGGSKVTGYLVRLHRSDDPSHVLAQQSVPATKFAVTFSKLANDVVYYARVFAINAQGQGDYTQSPDGEPTHDTAIINVAIASIGPDKIVNTRAGQSLADAPRMTVKGSNLDQPWGQDANHALEWVLYTSTSHNTVVGTDSISVDVDDAGASSFTITAPVAPGGASADSNHLIGPWRLKATYVADPNTPTTTEVAYSPDFYTTEAGSIIIGTVEPSPVHDGDTVTITGPDVGVATMAKVTIGGNERDVPLTRVDQNTVTLVMPAFGYQLAAGGDIVLQYYLNGNVLLTQSYDVDWDPTSDAGDGTGSSYVPPTAVDIPDGEQQYPQVILRWVFTDPMTGETYTVPRNPDAMTSPFPQRNVQGKSTAALDGQWLLTEGSPTPANWQFSGIAKDARHYEMLRHWVNDKGNRVVVTDHFGRDIECVLLNFNPVPKRDIHRYWSHTYTVTALVTKVGEPTVIPV